jgi:hypothetical protein
MNRHIAVTKLKPALVIGRPSRSLNPTQGIPEVQAAVAVARRSRSYSWLRYVDRSPVLSPARNLLQVAAHRKLAEYVDSASSAGWRGDCTSSIETPPPRKVENK